jgi:hypothetical protein
MPLYNYYVLTKKKKRKVDLLSWTEWKGTAPIGDL